MNRNSSNPVILQQKIIHLQAELSKYKSIKKEKLIVENQKLREQINQLQTENELLKSEFVRTNVREVRQTKPAELNNKTQRKSTGNITETEIEGNWFISNLIHERNKK